MKNFVKVLMPAVAFALASAGAVGSGTSTTTPDTIGWKRVAMNDCEEPVSCNNIPSQVCRTSSGAQAFAKIGLDCLQVLYHKP